MDEHQRKTYEISFYTKEESVAPVKAAIAAHHGEVVEERPVEKVHFEFKIAKESFAFLGVIRAALVPEEIAPMTRALSLAPGVLRFLITVAPSARDNKGEERKAMERKRPPAPRVASPEPSILTNEEIEKKIKEILQ